MKNIILRVLLNRLNRMIFRPGQIVFELVKSQNGGPNILKDRHKNYQVLVHGPTWQTRSTKVRLKCLGQYSWAAY